jgi:hypothetical protein
MLYAPPRTSRIRVRTGPRTSSGKSLACRRAQSLVERVLDSEPHLCAVLRSLTPVEHECGAHPFEQVAGDLLHLVAFLRTQIRPRSRQEIEHREFVLGQLLANMPLLFLRQRPAEGEKVP